MPAATAAIALALAVVAVDGRAAVGPPPAPDLVVASLSDPPERILPGGSFAVDDVTGNAGGRPAGDSDTAYFLTTGDHREAVGARYIRPLAVGAESAGRTQLDAPATIEDGTYDLEACADAYRNVRESDEGNNCRSASRPVVIDTTPPPAPVIREHPPAVTSSNDAGFEFTDDEPDARFECTIDQTQATPCTSPHDLLGLEDGPHSFAVVAVDAAGNRSAEARFEWTIIPDELTLGDGAWSWFADPRAIRFDGMRRRTYVGWVAGDGDVKVSAFDHDLLTRTTAVIAPKVEVDDHANPALQILPDGRIRVYWSAHGGTQMWYRTSLLPEDVSAWAPMRTMPYNSAGTRGYTYPNPIRLAGEQATYLFWRGGNYNPTFSIQRDGAETWLPARTLVSAPSARPYLKVDSNGSDTIAFAFTNDHPREGADVDIYYAEYRDGSLRKADGTPIGTLESPIAPGDADNVYDATSPEKSWVHDVALDAAGRPVIVFASFPSRDDHRYWYARWTGTAWDTHEITPAGPSFNPQEGEYYYSGGITLDHEDPSVVYLSRQVDGVFEVETWRTPDGGATWSEHAVTAGSETKNVRPVSPRGLTSFADDLSVIWMRGAYESYLDYRTSITTTLLTGGNEPPVADATAAPRTTRAGQTVTFDASTSRDPDGTIETYAWEFGDGSHGTGPQAEHVYRDSGRYFATLTVTDDGGDADRFVAELEIAPFADAWTGPATDVDGSSATLHGRLDPRGERTTYRFEYGATTEYGSATPGEEIAGGESGERAVQARLSDLTAGRYHYRLVATGENGTAAGEDRVLDVPPSGPGAYARLVLGTPGLVGYWRLGELDGSVARDETGTRDGTFVAPVGRGEKGALFDDPDSSALFGGSPGEVTMATPVPASAATVEGWFDWRAGVAMMRDHTGGGGWILGYERERLLSARVGGRELPTVRTVASLRGDWHHLAITVGGGVAALYLDGDRLQSGTFTSFAAPVLPWHVMRNGSISTQYTQGRADEIALYNRALTAEEIAERYRTGAGLEP
jgi:hypothetical protein